MNREKLVALTKMAVRINGGPYSPSVEQVSVAAVEEILEIALVEADAANIKMAKKFRELTDERDVLKAKCSELLEENINLKAGVETLQNHLAVMEKAEEDRVVEESTNKNSYTSNVKPVDALCRRLVIERTNPLWQHLRVIQEADRFALSFTPQFYRDNQDECSRFLNKIMERAHLKTFAAQFMPSGFLEIIGRRNSYRPPEPKL